MVVSAESPSVGAVVILDRDGVRIAGNYFEEQFRTHAAQQVRTSSPAHFFSAVTCVIVGEGGPNSPQLLRPTCEHAPTVVAAEATCGVV